MPVLFFNLRPGSEFLSCFQTRNVSPSQEAMGADITSMLPLFLTYTSGRTIPDVVASVSAAVAGVVCGETGARLGAVATR